MKKAKKSVKRIQRGSDGRFLKNQGKTTHPINFALQKASKEQIKALIEEISKLAAADAEVDVSLAALFEKYPRIKAAWEQAIAQRVEDVLKTRFAGPAQDDYRNITLNQLTEITGKTRRTVYDWLKKGLARNAEGTFNLPTFIHWFERYTVSKLPPQVVAAVNPLQAEKVKRLKMDLERQQGQLLDRGEVMAGQLARHQNLINSLTHKAEDLAMLCNGQPQSKIAELLNSFFDELLSQQCHVPEQLRLPEKAAQQFSELLNGLVIGE